MDQDFSIVPLTPEDCPSSLDHFALDRLETRAADFEFVSLYDVEI